MLHDDWEASTADWEHRTVEKKGAEESSVKSSWSDHQTKCAFSRDNSLFYERE